MYKQELQFSFFACPLMMLYISVKFHEFSSYRADAEITSVKFQRGITPKHMDKSYSSCVLQIV